MSQEVDLIEPSQTGQEETIVSPLESTEEADTAQQDTAENTSDIEPLNLESCEAGDTETGTDVALLNLDTPVPAPEISLEDPPRYPSDIAEGTNTSGRSSSRSSSRSSRSRSRSHRHRHSHWRNRFQLKKKESNFVAAACSMIVVVLLCTAMAEPKWFNVRGGGCRDEVNEAAVHYLGLHQFFYVGSFIHMAEDHNKVVSYTYYKYGPNTEDAFVDCVTPEVVQVLRSIIALCSLAVLFTIFAFLLDLHGPSVRCLKNMQRYAVLSMITVALCVVINGFCYWASQLLEALQLKTKSHIGSKVEVQFSVGFYLVSAAGGMAVIAAGSNLLRRPSLIDEEQRDRDRLLEDYDGYPPDPYGPVGFVTPAPPPPYQP